MRVKKYINQLSDLNNQIIIVTGANSGVGYALTLLLLQKGARVIMANRNEHKSKEAIDKINKKIPNAALSFLIYDQANTQSIEQFVLHLKEKNVVFDGIVLNAGVYMPGEGTTNKGLPLTFGTNYYGAYYLLKCLADHRLLSSSTRVVFTSSPAAKKELAKDKIDQIMKGSKSHQHQQYCYSKTALDYLALSLMANENNVFGVSFKTYLYHPGVTVSNIVRFKFKPLQIAAYVFVSLFFHSPAKASLGALYALTTKEEMSGKYIMPRGFFNINGIPTLKKIAASTHVDFAYLLAQTENL